MIRQIVTCDVCNKDVPKGSSYQIIMFYTSAWVVGSDEGMKLPDQSFIICGEHSPRESIQINFLPREINFEKENSNRN